MQLTQVRALLTGAGGGIGRAIATELISRGAQVMLVDRDERALSAVAAGLGALRPHAEACVTDLTSVDDRKRLCEVARTWRGGVNVLINNAGLNPFGLYEQLQPAQIDAALAVNLQVPLHLCHEMLPHLRRQPQAAIVNTGSVFGAIGFPGYVAYSTTKFALRGFTEALRRELAGSSVTVQYLAPRATRTPINSSAVERMNAELGVAMDPPERVARELAELLRTGRRSAVVGWPEKLFVRINALLPALVDRSLLKQLPIIQRFAQASQAAQHPSAASVAPAVEVRRQAT